MEIKNLQTKENLLLNRKEITAELNFTGKTPSYTEVQDLIAKECKAQKETISIKHIYTAFGAAKAKLIANIYKTTEDRTKTEPKKKEKTTQKTEAQTEKK